MTSVHPITIKIVYSGRKEDIICPPNARYEDFIKLAIERFQIPVEFQDFVLLTNKYKYSFTRESFERYLHLGPTQNASILLRVDYNSLLRILPEDERAYLLTLVFKSKRNAINNRRLPSPLMQGHCQYTDMVDIMELPDEPMAKRPRVETPEKNASKHHARL